MQTLDYSPYLMPADQYRLYPGRQIVRPSNDALDQSTKWKPAGISPFQRKTFNISRGNRYGERMSEGYLNAPTTPILALTPQAVGMF
jgi:hypothetical protein